MTDVELAQRIREGCTRARNALVERHRGLARYAARRWRWAPYYEDLVQEVCLGLLEAAARFDPAHGRPFPVLASWWAWKALQDFLAGNRLIAVPASLQKQARGWKSGGTFSAAAVEYGRQFLARGQFDLSDREDYLATAELDPARLIADRDDVAALYRALARLPERERTLLALRYGLDGHDAHTLTAAGRAVGITREWARHLERRALATLRQELGA
jgi:RNA polymerase primary sigma factor